MERAYDRDWHRTLPVAVHQGTPTTYARQVFQTAWIKQCDTINKVIVQKIYFWIWNIFFIYHSVVIEIHSLCFSLNHGVKSKLSYCQAHLCLIEGLYKCSVSLNLISLVTLNSIGSFYFVNALLWTAYFWVTPYAQNLKWVFLYIFILHMYFDIYLLF